jgi:hypothetical protein
VIDIGEILKEVPNLVNQIPEMLQYFIPGFIFMKPFRFLNANNDNKQEPSSSMILIVTISFIAMSIVRFFDSIIIPQCYLLLWPEVAITLFISFVAAIIVYEMQGCKLLASALNRVTNKSINRDLWRDVIDYENGTILKIFMRNQNIIYFGKLAAHEEKGIDSWILLTDYICTYTDKKEEFNSINHPTPTRVMIPFNQIERVELFYDENTNIFDK